ACGQTGPDIASSEPQPTPTTGPLVAGRAAYSGTALRTNDGKLFVGDSAVLQVFRTEKSEFANLEVLAFGGGSEVWTAKIRLPLEEAQGGSGVADIKQIPLEPRIAYVERQRGKNQAERMASASRAASGTVRYTLDGRKVALQIDSNLDAV